MAPGGEAKAHLWHEYAGRAEAFYALHFPHVKSVRRIFIATDDASVVEEMRKGLEDWEVMVRTILFFFFFCVPESFSKKKSLSGKRGKDVEHVYLGAGRGVLTDVFLLAETR